MTALKWERVEGQIDLGIKSWARPLKSIRTYSQVPGCFSKTHIPASHSRNNQACCTYSTGRPQAFQIWRLHLRYIKHIKMYLHLPYRREPSCSLLICITLLDEYLNFYWFQLCNFPSVFWRSPPSLFILWCVFCCGSSGSKQVLVCTVHNEFKDITEKIRVRFGNLNLWRIS